MIIGTAGHIDHGKTTLVKALTGVDADRLPEEKARGITIELGYAFLDVPGLTGTAARIGFIDVPGHERFVHTMLAGATGIDLALLLVAADDGVMPQTREHLAVLCLLGLTRGVIAITKCDRVDAARVDAVRLDIAALLAGTTFAESPVVAVSATTGAGLTELKALLFAAAREDADRIAPPSAFRLAVDRVFTLSGSGTVVTGSVHRGTVRIGDELILLPSPVERRVRVRSLHAQNQSADLSMAGERCALALASIAREDIARGQWLCAPDAANSTDRLDAELTLWREEERPLRSGTSVHVHLGACDVMATVAVLDAPNGTHSLIPGETGRVQLVLHKPVGAWHGDRVVLRDASASRTLAGGRVLSTDAPVRYRRTPQRIAMLDAWSLPTPEARLAGLLAASPTGIDLTLWSRAEGRSGGVPGAAECPDGTLFGQDAASAWALGPAHRQGLDIQVLDKLAAFHGQHPDELGPDTTRLRLLVAPRLAEALWRALLAQQIASGVLSQRGAQVFRPEHGVRLSAVDERIAQKLMPALEAGAFDPPWVRDLVASARESEVQLRMVMGRLAQRGDLHQVVKDLYYPTRTMSRLAQLARAIARRDGEIKAAAFRDATGLGRKRAIQVLEYFDRVGLLRRVQESHRLRPDTELFTETEPEIA